MAMQTDVKAAHATGNGVLYAGRTRVKAIVCLGATTAGDVVLYDNASAASGDVLIRFAVPGNSNNVIEVALPGEGIVAQNGIYASVPTGYSVTVIYG
jgi:hypothetical protein